MPGPVPSVSTKTRGYIQPPDFHTPRNNYPNGVAADASYSPTGFTFPTPFNNRNQNSYDSPYQPPWKDSLNNDANTYIPSYQKKVPANPPAPRQYSNNQRSQQYFKTIPRQPPPPPQQNYRPASVQPINLVHRQFNSPMGLYSNNNIQDVMKSHVSHISRVR